MSLAYLLGGMLIGALAALAWLVAGGSFAGAAAAYVLAGQSTLAAMVAHVALAAPVHTR